MADVSPFRAIRYTDATPTVVAPPYDVIDEQEHKRLAALDPHNVVHLTLADDPAVAAATFHRWLDEGVLVADSEPSAWQVVQDYVGPDGVARSRKGILASVRVEPYERRVVLPHERTHAGPKEGRLALLRAVGVQLEPIFMLYDGVPPAGVPEGEPDLEASGSRLWRVSGEELAAAFAERQLLIADGHHRYETALAFAEETGGRADRMPVVLVSTSDPGLEIFPTHRVFAGRADISVTGERCDTVGKALAALAGEPFDRSAAVHVTRETVELVRGEPGELDVELVDRFGHDGIGYTPDADEAVARVERGEADCAFLLRATRIEDVFDRARRGEVMPQKTTYFFPKLTSGLVFHPA